MTDTRTELLGKKLKITIMTGSREEVIYLDVPSLLGSGSSETDDVLYMELDKTEYHLGETLDYRGSKVFLQNSKGERLFLDPMEDSITNNADMSIIGSQDVTFTYKASQTITINIKEDALEISTIAISTLPAKLSYVVGESLDLTGLVLTVYYKGSKDTKNINKSEVTASGFDSSVPMTNQEVTLTYEENGTSASTSFLVNIVKPGPITLEDINRISVQVYDGTYYMHEKFLKTDFNVIGSTSTGEEIPIPSEYCSFIGYNTERATLGTPQNVTVSFNNSKGTYSTTFQITVVDMRRYLIGFRMDVAPTKDRYAVHTTSVSLSGGLFSARYQLSNKDTKWIPIYNGFLSTSIDSDTVTVGKDAKVTVTYGTFKVTYPVKIVEEGEDE